jgi:hypothetical protein
MSIPTVKYSAENKDSIVINLIGENVKQRGERNSVLASHYKAREFDDLLSAFSNLQQNLGFCTGLMYLSGEQFDQSTKDSLSIESYATIKDKSETEQCILTRISANLNRLVG